MSIHKKFHGTGVAIVTPFKNHEVDYDGLTNVVNHVIDGGVEYLVVLGSTGEAATVNPQEERKILNKVIEVNAGRKPIVAGNFSGNNTIENCKKIAAFDLTGIDALLISSPAYIKPSQIGIYKHYMALAEASPIPIIIYNVPGRTRSNIEWTTTVKLAKDNSKFIGIKEALASDFKTAHQLNLDLYDLHKWLYIEGNPVGIKAAMEVIEKCGREVRLPLHHLSDENFDSLKEEMRRIMSLG